MATSRSSSSRKQLQKNSEKLLQNWSPPKVPVHDVYHRRGIFEFRPDYKIKTVENTVAIRDEYQDFQLLERHAIEEYRMNNFDSLHFGLVQVAVKPLTANGLNSSVVVCLRDCRCLRFNDSRLAVAESSLRDGPIYFNCYPDYQVYLKDPHILTALTLSFKTDRHLMENQGSEEEEEEEEEDIAVFYRVYYKVLSLTASFDPKSKVPLSVGKTTFIETNLLREDKVSVPKTVEWDSFEVPERWNMGSE